jgi:hypothetical protein
VNATQEQHEYLASIIVYWLNGADTIVAAYAQGSRIALSLLQGGLKRGIERKGFYAFIGKISLAFKDLLEKQESDEKSEDGTGSFMILPELKEDMVAKELDYHCNSLCFTLFVGVEHTIDKELKALAVEAALDSLVAVCDRHLSTSGDGVATANIPNLLGEMDNCA